MRDFMFKLFSYDFKLFDLPLAFKLYIIHRVGRCDNHSVIFPVCLCDLVC